MERNKKITLITFSNFPFGGASANLLRLYALGLSENNSIVEVILPSGHYYGNTIGKIEKRSGSVGKVIYKYLCFINHPKFYLGKILDNFLGLVLLVFYLIKKALIKEVDLLIAYGTTFSHTLTILIAKTLINKKLVIILPEFYEKPASGFYSVDSIKWYGFYLSIKYLVRYADGFIVLSTYMERYIKEKLKIDKQILLMPNLTDKEIFNITGVKPFIENKITIGYIGTPPYKDGVLDLIKSFGKLNEKYPSTHLLIIGDLTNGKSLIPELKEYAKKITILDNISFTGLVPYSQVPELLHSCQILALTRPSGIRSEAGFPTKLGEYFACKKPVIITKVGDIPKYFKNEYHAIFVEPGNINSIVNGFEKLITNSSLCNILGNNGYNWMDKNLNYINVAYKNDKFLDSILGIE